MTGEGRAGVGGNFQHFLVALEYRELTVRVVLGLGDGGGGGEGGAGGRLT